jgi:hypothetical protein
MVGRVAIRNPPRRWSFTLRTLFAVPGFAAICLAVARALRVDDTPIWLGGAAALFWLFRF